MKKSKEFLRVNILGSSMLKGGSKFELKWIPALKKMTGSEPKEGAQVQVWFRPVEIVSMFVFLAEVFAYLFVLGAIGKMTWGVASKHPTIESLSGVF